MNERAAGRQLVGISMPAVLACAIVSIAPQTIGAQLRPLEQASWTMLERGRTISASIGASRLFEQRASLAGTTGDLWEAGTFSLAWRTGRVVLEAAGTAQRFFSETGRFTEPYADVQPSSDGHRHDSGDYRLSTAVRLTPDSWPFAGGFRFGTRLPTTNNSIGLDRDAIDFFGTVGGSALAAGIAISGEAGLSINSTREARFEQDDLFVYSIRAELAGARISPTFEALGQMHGSSHSAIRGVENLGEVRVGLRAGSRRWLRVEGVKGYETFSPSSGVIVSAGIGY